MELFWVRRSSKPRAGRRGLETRASSGCWFFLPLAHWIRDHTNSWLKEKMCWCLQRDVVPCGEEEKSAQLLGVCYPELELHRVIHALCLNCRLSSHLIWVCNLFGLAVGQTAGRAAAGETGFPLPCPCSPLPGMPNVSVPCALLFYCFPWLILSDRSRGVNSCLVLHQGK